ncbi:MAG: hypothetical protein IKI67_05730 [Bacteroidales bacterium]|nr:hypothetical protein [Bacteroidales bacterium]
MRRIVAWWKNLDDPVKGLILIGLVALIGIIIRWRPIIEGIKKGFGFYSGYAD